MPALSLLSHLLYSSDAGRAHLAGRSTPQVGILTASDKAGFIAMGVVALCSFVASLGLLSFLTYRFIFWRQYYKRPLAQNQYVVLIYNLLLVDLQQATAFLLCLHWVSKGYVYYPSAPCVLQGWWIQIGDPGSGLFVLAIAMHTGAVVLRGRQLPFPIFVASVVGLWIFIIILGLIPVGLFGSETFVISEAGWVSGPEVAWYTVSKTNLSVTSPVLVESTTRDGATMATLSMDFPRRIRYNHSLRNHVFLPPTPYAGGGVSASESPRKLEAIEPGGRLHGHLSFGLSGAVASVGGWPHVNRPAYYS